MELTKTICPQKYYAGCKILVDFHPSIPTGVSYICQYGKGWKKSRVACFHLAKGSRKHVERPELTWSSFTIIKHSSLSNPFSPKVPSVVWISEKRRLLVTSWWVFISYQVFSWSMWHVILQHKAHPKPRSSWGVEMGDSTALGHQTWKTAGT